MAEDRERGWWTRGPARWVKVIDFDLTLDFYVQSGPLSKKSTKICLATTLTPRGICVTINFAPEQKTDPLNESGRRAARAALVVDNLSVNLDLARRILEPSGYKVLTAGGIAEGLDLAGEADCDLSDVCMGGETGYDLGTL